MVLRHRQQQWVLAWLLLLAGLVVVQATEGVNTIGQGAVQKSLAGAGVASPQDSSWVLLNPAVLPRIGCQADVSLSVFAPDRSLDSSQNSAGRSDDDSIFFIPTASAKLCAWNDIHLGIGLFGSSGMGTKYDNARIPWFGGDSQAEYAVAKLIIAGAVDLGDGWSIGAGPVLVVSRMRTDMFNGVGPSSNKWDYAFGGGLSIGVVKRWERLSIGASYLTEQYQEKWDEYRDLMPNRLDLPEQVQIGVAYAITDSVEVMLDYRFIHWSAVPQWGDEPDEGGFGWHDQHCFKAGVQWRVNEDFTLRAGVSHADSPIRSDAVFANGLFPAITETHVACGFSYRLNEKMDLNMSYTHAFHNSLTDDGSQLDGRGEGTKITMHQNSVTAGLTYRF